MGRKESRDRRRVSVTWMLLAVVTAVALTVGACALWLPDRAPALLGQAGEVSVAPVNTQQYAGQQQVTIVPTMSSSRDLRSNTSGIVTADSSADGLNSGKAAFRVADRTVVALATASPLFRDLAVGDQGEDVRALNDELNRLGYRASAGSNWFTAATAAGWKQLMVDAGNTSDGNVMLADTLWIPSPSVNVGEWRAVADASVNAGEPIGTIPGTIEKLSIKNGQPSDHARTLTVFGQTTTLPAGQTEIADPAFCQAIAACEEFQVMDEAMLSAGFDGSLTLDQPIEVLRVPAGAMFGIDGTSGCLATAEGKTVKVEIVGSELGVSLARPADGSDPAAIGKVALGTALAERACK